MRQAPAFRLVMTQARSWRVVEAGLPALAAAVALAWLASQLALTPAAVTLSALLAAAIVGGWRWGRVGRAAFTIEWDGASWTLDPGTPQALVLCRLDVALDLDRFLLLRAVSAPPLRQSRWLALAMGSDPASERALCVALYAARAPAAAAGPDVPGV